MMPEFDIKKKIQLHRFLETFLQERILEAKDLVQSLTESRNHDTKSSAGDKYETGRAMMQQQIDLSLGELHKTEVHLNNLRKLDPDTGGRTVTAGSLVMTSQGQYYILTGIGKVEWGGLEFFVISPAAPLSQQMISRKQNDRFSFAGKEFEILSVI